MRIIISNLWHSGISQKRYLVGPQEMNLLDASMLGEIRQINPSLEAAVARDIAAEGGGALAQQIDQGKTSDAQDIAKLIFLSSLSTSINPILGLGRSEIIGYLAAPDRDVLNLRHALDRLLADANYLHPTREGKLFFKNVENLRAKVATYARNKLREQREKELRERLSDMFKITTKAAYQKLLPLPALDQIQLQGDQVSLVVFRPVDESFRAIEEFYNHQQYKNRICFLTGAAKAYETVLERAAELSAIRTIIGEMDQAGMKESDAQYVEATDILSKLEGRFYQACRETFTILYYPSRNGLTQVELDPKYVANDYKGEEQVLNALKECYKYTEDIAPDGTFRTRVESKLWPPGLKEVPWSSIKHRAATDPSWVWHHPSALDNLKDELVKREIWREMMGHVDRGPFEKPRTSVQVLVLNRDENSGQVTLRVRPLNGDMVYMEENGVASPSSRRLEEYEIKTKALQLSFLCVDSKGEHGTGEAFAWENMISIKHRFYQEGSKRKCELQAIPEGRIRYTTDGSSAETHGVSYEKPFEIGRDAQVILAVAEARGIKSKPYSIPAPKGKADAPIIDRSRAAVWKRNFKKDSTGETYQFWEATKRHGAELGSVRLTVMRDTRWVELNTPEDVFYPVLHFEGAAQSLKNFVPDGNLSVDVGSLKFDSGQQLLDFVAEIKTEIREGEVVQ